MNNGFIYIIKNTINSKVYIGQTRVNVDKRWKEHLRHAQYGDQLINRAMKKYGVDKFYIETLEVCDIDIIDEREIYYIDLYDSTDVNKGYNVSIGGKTPRFKRKSLSIAELVDLYVNKHFSLDRIAEKYEVSRYIITTELQNAGITLRGSSDRNNPKYAKINKEELQKKMLELPSVRKVAKYFNVSISVIRNACTYYNIEYNFSKSAQHYKYMDKMLTVKMYAELTQ